MSDALNRLTDLLDYAKRNGADAADALLVESTDIAVSIRKGKPEDLERAESSGVGLRILIGQKSAMVSSTDLSTDALYEACDRAIAMARASIADPHIALAEASLWPQSFADLDLYDSHEPSISWLQEQCQQAEAVALEQPGITNSEGASAHVSRNHIALAMSSGFAHAYSTSSCSLSACVIAGEGAKMERDHAYSVARFTEDLSAPETIGKLAAERTLRRLNPTKVKTQSTTIIFDPRAARSLLSNFASAINGAAIARGTSFLREKMGESIFSSGITIWDDPHRKRGLGSKPFDAEGVANRKRALVEDGVLQSWLLDLRSANQLGLQTTGHASRSIGSAPHPSSSNLYIEPGTASPQALMRDIQSGFYVTDLFGMGVNLVTGDYSQGASGLWIENGEPAFAVSELTIASTLSEMFAHLTAANDLVFEYATNSPTLRVERMMVAGA